MDDHGIAGTRLNEIKSRPEPRKRFRRMASSLCLGVCAVLLVLWMRSFYSLGYVEWGLPTGRVFKVHSFQGRIQFLYYKGIYDPETRSYYSVTGLTAGTCRMGFHPIDKYLGNIAEAQKFIRNGFTATIRLDFWEVAKPHYLLLLTFFFLAYLLKPKPKLQFKIMDMFVVVTFLAITLGAIEALAEK